MWQWVVVVRCIPATLREHRIWHLPVLFAKPTGPSLRPLGPLGTNRDYLEQVAAQLLALQIRDDYIADLLRHIQRSDTHET